MVWIPYLMSLAFVALSVILLFKRPYRGENIALCATLLWLAMIFSFSLQDASRSEETSGVVTKVVREVLERMDVQEERIIVTEDLVRSIAHIFEFFVLGMLAYTSMRLLRPHRVISPEPLVFGVLMPIADECVQLGSDGRAFQLIDMMKDWSGFTGGLLLALALYALFHQPRKGRRVSKVSAKIKI